MLGWEPSPDPNAVGYNIYYGTASHSYSTKIPVGNVSSATLNGLTAGQTYYFAATTFDAANQESGFSNEASYQVPETQTNQPPTLNAISNLTINQNTAQQSISLAGISSGSASEKQTLTVTASSSNPSIVPNPKVTYTSPNAAGSLTFTPVNNAYGSANISVTVNDGGFSNNVITRTFKVTVNPINQTPTLNAINNLTINQNVTAQAVSLTGISSGSANEQQTLIVTAVSSSPSLIANPGVIYTSPNATGSLTFTPVKNAFGSANISVTVNDGGGSNNIITRTFNVTVNTVNQTPTLSVINNLIINENSANHSVALSGISSGSANEKQILSVTALSSKTSLIPNPTVSYTSPNSTGSLVFSPVVNAFGTASITVTVKDGGTSNNIISRTFNVTVNPVNQTPTLNGPGDVTIDQDTGTQTITLSGISSGAANENQTLTLTAGSSNPALIPRPTINYTSPKTTGSLTFVPVNGASGTATITVMVNDGGGSNNILSRTFAVNVNPTQGTNLGSGGTNHPPTLNPIKNKTVFGGFFLQSVGLSGISSGDPEANQKLTVKAVSSNHSVVSTPKASYKNPKSKGSLKYFAMPNSVGNSAVTVTVSDDGGPSRVVTQTFIINVVGFGYRQSGRPSITELIATNSALVGQNVTFSVTAKGKGPLKYQWQFNGSDLTSETNSILNLKNLAVTQSGDYCVIVFNSRGAVRSATTSLTVSAHTKPAVVPYPLPVEPPQITTLTTIGFVNGAFTLQVSGPAKNECIVQSSTNLVDWISVETNLIPFIFTDHNSINVSSSFYRTVGW